MSPVNQAVLTLAVFWLVRLFVRDLLNKARGKSFSDNAVCKIYFNRSERFAAKTPVQTASLAIRESGLELKGDMSLMIPYTEISSVRLEYPHSAIMRAHVIEIKYHSGELIYLGVLRAALFKFFVINNVLKTVTLFETLRKKLPKSLSWVRRA